MLDYQTCTSRALSETAYCWTTSESLGMLLLVLAGAASCLSTLAVYGTIIKRALKTGRNPINVRMDVLMLSLLFANLVHSVGSLLNIKWLMEGYSDVGTFCTVQGVFNQVGPVAVAINTIAIAIWTFVTLWSLRGVQEHLRPAWYMILAIWLVVFLVTAAPDLKYRKQEHRYWKPTPLWCTISKDYEHARLFGKYLWFWIAFLSFILYLPLALLARRNLTRDRNARLGFRLHQRRERDDEPGEALLYSMIAYPVSNAFLIIPLSIVRWNQLTGSKPIRTGGSIAAQTIFDLNGFVNVMLLVFYRPGLFKVPVEEPTQIEHPPQTPPGPSPPTASGPLPTTAPGDFPLTPTASGSSPARRVRTRNESDSVLDRSEAGSILTVPRVTNGDDVEMVRIRANQT